ncbi:MAG: type II secretion system protein [Thermodesulfobacteriota bacterium]
MAIENSSRGFTLLEVMIALAIVGIALVTLLSLANRAVQLEHEQQQLTRATMLAARRMAEFEIDHRQGRNGAPAEEGGFADPFAAFRWRVAVADTLLPEVLQVTVTVLWGAERKMEKVELTSFVLRRQEG